MTLKYPEFSLDEYRKVLLAICEYRDVLRICDFECSELPRVGKVLILRHDIDFSPAMAMDMAATEHDLGLRSTYFVGLHLQYNPHYHPHARAIRAIAGMGHEIGFHFDGAVYDGLTINGAETELRRHVSILGDIADTKITSIAMHNPSLASGGDPFQEYNGYLNAYDSEILEATTYISDSCRAWRNGGLAPCFDNACERVYLLIHPELWQKCDTAGRLAFLNQLRTALARESTTHLDGANVIWQQHTGGKEHDARVEGDLRRQVTAGDGPLERQGNP